jgi:hypothetical protein
VNDEPAHIYQTNLAFQGVAVPPGRSRIVLEFWSASLILGASITLSALVLAVGWFCGTGAAVCRGKDPVNIGLACANGFGSAKLAGM